MTLHEMASTPSFFVCVCACAFVWQIDSALLAIALDDRETPDFQAECRAFLTGDSGRNRWFDKHQLVRANNWGGAWGQRRGGW